MTKIYTMPFTYTHDDHKYLEPYQNRMALWEKCRDDISYEEASDYARCMMHTLKQYITNVLHHKQNAPAFETNTRDEIRKAQKWNDMVRTGDTIQRVRFIKIFKMRVHMGVMLQFTIADYNVVNQCRRALHRWVDNHMKDPSTFVPWKILYDLIKNMCDIFNIYIDEAVALSSEMDKAAYVQRTIEQAEDWRQFKIARHHFNSSHF